MTSLTWSDIASLTYGSSFVFLIMIISVMIYLSEKKQKSFTSFIKKVWYLKSIYGALILYVYDTATDIGVVIFFYQLSKEETNDEINYESINMKTMFELSVVSIVLVRVIWLCYGCGLLFLKIFCKPCYCEPCNMMCCDLKPTICHILMLVFCGLLDGFVLLAAINSMIMNDPKMSRLQKITSWVEAIFESVPQLIIQTVFIVRAQNDPILYKKSDAFYLIVLSIFSSILNISNKYVSSIDEMNVIVSAKSSHFNAKNLCGTYTNEKLNVDIFNICGASLWFIVRVVWRVSVVALNFLIFALLWAINGGSVLFYYFIFCSICNFVVLETLLYAGKLGIDKSDIKGVCCGICIAFPMIVYAAISTLNPISILWVSAGFIYMEPVMIAWLFFVIIYAQYVAGITLITIAYFEYIDCEKHEILCRSGNNIHNQVTSVLIIMIYVMMGISVLFNVAMIKHKIINPDEDDETIDYDDQRPEGEFPFEECCKECDLYRSKRAEIQARIERKQEQKKEEAQEPELYGPEKRETDEHMDKADGSVELRVATGNDDNTKDDETVLKR
eukprot:48906_1